MRIIFVILIMSSINVVELFKSLYHQPLICKDYFNLSSFACLLIFNTCKIFSWRWIESLSYATAKLSAGKNMYDEFDRALKQKKRSRYQLTGRLMNFEEDIM